MEKNNNNKNEYIINGMRESPIRFTFKKNNKVKSNGNYKLTTSNRQNKKKNSTFFIN